MESYVEILLVVDDKTLTLYDDVHVMTGDSVYTLLFDKLEKEYPEFGEDFELEWFEGFVGSPDVKNDDKLVTLSFLDGYYIEREMIMDLIYAFRTSKIVSPYYNQVADVLEELYTSDEKYRSIILNISVDGDGYCGDLSYLPKSERKEIIKSLDSFKELYNDYKK